MPDILIKSYNFKAMPKLISFSLALSTPIVPASIPPWPASITKLILLDLASLLTAKLCLKYVFIPKQELNVKITISTISVAFFINITANNMK